MIHVLAVLGVVLVVALAWQGWKLGLLRRVLEFAGVIFSLFFATAQAGRLGASFTAWSGLEGRPRLYLGWVVLFLIGLLLTRLVAALAAKAVQVSIVGWVDRGGGLLFGLLIGLFVAGALLNVASRLPGDPERRAAYLGHPVAGPLIRVAALIPAGAHRLGDAPERAWDGLRHGARRAAEAVGDKADRLRPGTGAAADSAAGPPAGGR